MLQHFCLRPSPSPPGTDHTAARAACTALEDGQLLPVLFRLPRHPHQLKTPVAESEVIRYSSPVCYAHLKELRDGF